MHCECRRGIGGVVYFEWVSARIKDGTVGARGELLCRQGHRHDRGAPRAQRHRRRQNCVRGEGGFDRGGGGGGGEEKFPRSRVYAPYYPVGDSGLGGTRGSALRMHIYPCHAHHYGHCAELTRTDRLQSCANVSAAAGGPGEGARHEWGESATQSNPLHASLPEPQTGRRRFEAPAACTSRGEGAGAGAGAVRIHQGRAAKHTSTNCTAESSPMLRTQACAASLGMTIRT